MTPNSPATLTTTTIPSSDRHRQQREHPPRHHGCVDRNRSRTRPTPYLIITNISKKQNVKNLLQVAAAYGVTSIFVVGQRRLFVFDPDVDDTDVPPQIRDAIGDGKLTITKFDKLEECAAHVRGIVAVDGACSNDDGGASRRDHGADDDGGGGGGGGFGGGGDGTRVRIIGVEITNTSRNLEDDPFSSYDWSTSCGFAFMMGNEGSGMTARQMSICDGFVRISQYGGGTASLNVSVAAGLVLHRFFHWRRGE
ncbi:hypothetical protein ACHAXA_006809 [Cyclostephanos tholiformis]|uniref:tRNA/rRNA methyltransferase SpoU type domain-containing protein n=1 Tax=Cyclostephanos tholiformis TaxID=382380 RepID=A0ABD3RQT3_9STRA